MKKLILGITLLIISFSLFAQKKYRGAEVYSGEQVLYGKFIMSMKMVKGSGMLSTFFLYKSDSYLPGIFWEEIDIEILGKEDATIFSTNIITDGLSGNTKNSVKEIHLDYSLADDFHLYTLEWTPEYVAWYIDSVELRRETGSVVSDLTSPESYRFNTWISCSVPWVGVLDRSNLPRYQYVDWIVYYSYDNGDFIFGWKDEFDTFDNDRWSKANWTFECNEVDFITDNAYIEDGKLVLALTDPNPVTASIDNLTTVEDLNVFTDNSLNELNIVFSERGNYIIQVFDLTGKSLLTVEVNDEMCIIPYTGISPGIYVLRVKSEEKLITRKVCIGKKP